MTNCCRVIDVDIDDWRCCVIGVTLDEGQRRFVVVLAILGDSDDVGVEDRRFRERDIDICCRVIQMDIDDRRFVVVLAM